MSVIASLAVVKTSAASRSAVFAAFAWARTVAQALSVAVIAAVTIVDTFPAASVRLATVLFKAAISSALGGVPLPASAAAANAAFETVEAVAEIAPAAPSAVIGAVTTDASCCAWVRPRPTLEAVALVTIVTPSAAALAAAASSALPAMVAAREAVPTISIRSWRRRPYSGPLNRAPVMTSTSSGSRSLKKSNIIPSISALATVSKSCDA